MERIVLTRRNAGFLVFAAMALVFLIDSVTGYEIALSIFYLIPVSIATWYYSRTIGLWVSIVCAICWLISETLSGRPYSNDIIVVWNTMVRLGFFVIVTLTLAELRRSNAELIAAREEALAATRAKSDFVNRVTHELRTPLTAILGFADVLQKRAAPYLMPDHQGALRRIRNNAEALLELVDGILDMGRAEAGKTMPQAADVDLAELLGTIEKDMASRVNSSRVSLQVDVPAGTAPIHTDPHLMRQVLLNLVANATKFTEAGSISVRVQTEGDGQPVAISVEDTGIGIQPERLKAIFEPFEQADETIHRSYGGAGLGLSIARDLCELLNCELTVQSTPGAGSCFTVLLPDAQARAYRNSGPDRSHLRLMRSSEASELSEL